MNFPCFGSAIYAKMYLMSLLVSRLYEVEAFTKSKPKVAPYSPPYPPQEGREASRSRDQLVTESWQSNPKSRIETYILDKFG